MIPPQIVMAGDSARTRRNDPITSHEAADSNATVLKDSQLYVQALFAFHGPMADHELVQRAESEQYLYGEKVDGSWSPSRLRTARHELTKLGVVEDTGIYRLTPSNKRAKLWALVETPAPQRVTVWRIVSKDPDEISQYHGVLIRETADRYEIQVDGETFPEPFPKFNSAGVTVWRLQ